MIRVPRVLPTSLDPGPGANEDELTRLEADRAQLRSMIASEAHTAADLIFWLRLIMVAALAAVGLLLFLADNISATDLVWIVAIGGALIFALTLRVQIYGEPYHIGILVLCLLSGLGGEATGIVPAPTRPTPRDLLADCEAKITRLKDNRS